MFVTKNRHNNIAMTKSRVAAPLTPRQMLSPVYDSCFVVKEKATLVCIFTLLCKVVLLSIFFFAFGT